MDAVRAWAEAARAGAVGLGAADWDRATNGHRRR